MKFLKTNLTIPPSVITGVCAMKQAGKSLYAFEQGYQIVKEEGGEVLYLDTEEPDDFMFTVGIEKDEAMGMDAHRPWKEVFAEKYGIEPVIDYKYLPNVETIMDFIGVHGKVIIVEGEEKKKKDGSPGEVKGAKFEFKTVKVDTENSPFNKLINEKDVRYVVIDSITVFNSLIIGGRQNFGIRAQVEDSFFQTIKTLCAKRKEKTGKPVYVFTTNHLAYDPTNMFATKMDEQFLIEKGGKTIGHTHKVLFGFKKYIRPHGARELVVMRYPNLPEFGFTMPLLITENGFQNTDEKELNAVKEAQKAEREA